ncbi:methyltransferase domain-containing protein [Sphingobium sp. B12D2B]|uniref:methyltransferase domain-containing protein n=1 Tax=Sphingobium sp. B12D2B TaxID=2940577 RepID=UPI002224BBAC|nr:methyltransferase domain-containing protein [Sphingobium sp. B12D2B]MCW2351377.1 malonyl-CoA O-methyltransferase [Sphingobium sp. B12D2B]
MTSTPSWCIRAAMVSDCKTRIGAAFGAAAPRYEGDAGVHRHVAMRLLDFATGGTDAGARDPATVLEIGCGTGLLTRLIAQRWPNAALTATDIAPGMIAAMREAGSPARLLLMDGERPDLGTERFDLILSSLAFQWFEDLPAALARLHGLLAPGGSLCFATMGAESFSDWRAAHAREGLVCGLRDYPDRDEVAAMAQALGQCDLAEELIPLPAPGGLALARHFHAIGARVPQPGYRRLASTSLRRVMARFDTDSGASNYHIIYGRLWHD